MVGEGVHIGVNQVPERSPTSHNATPDHGQRVSHPNLGRTVEKGPGIQVHTRENEQFRSASVDKNIKVKPEDFATGYNTVTEN